MNLKNRLGAKAVALTICILTSALCSSFIFNLHPPHPSQSDQGQSYAVLISQPNHVKAAVNTAQTITKESTYKREVFVVMACAKSVEAFVKGSDFADLIEKGKAAGIQFKVCGMSLQQFNIHPDSLMEEIEVVPNGLTYLFDLQIEGFKTVEL